MIRTSKITVGTTPTLLTVHPERDWERGQTVMIRNTGLASVYVGGPDVTADGFPVAASGTLTLDLSGRRVRSEDEGEQVYAVAASGTVVVVVLQQGV